MGDLISVIVPVHNAEKYLHECVESILSQTYKKIEILLVDDCSNDKSAQICDDYAKMDSRIRVIHRVTKGGEGGAVARNNGIAEAQGTILYFMDSDDYIEKDMLEKMYSLMCCEKSDCVVTSFHYVDADKNELSWYTPHISGYNCMNGKETARIFLTTLDIEGFSWNKLIRRELIDEYNICFDETMNSFVDMYNMFKTVLHSKRVSFYHAKPYYYRQHNVSCVHTMTKRKLDNFKRVINQIVELSKKQEMMEEAEYFYLYRMVSQLYDTVKNKSGYDVETWKAILTEYRCSVIFKHTFIKGLKLMSKYTRVNKVKAIVKLCTVYIVFK